MSSSRSNNNQHDVSATQQLPPPPDAAVSSANHNHNKGIDLHDALAILAERQQQPHEHHHEHHDNNHKEEEYKDDDNNPQTSCHDDASSSHQQQPLGQVIDLLAPPNETTNSTTNDKDNNVVDPTQSKVHAEPQNSNRLEKFERQVAQMSLSERIQVVLRAQQDRVATYRQFDDGLADALQSHNLTLYPALVAQVTATFAVLSDTVNCVRQHCQKTAQLATLLTQLQRERGKNLPSKKYAKICPAIR